MGCETLVRMRFLATVVLLCSLPTLAQQQPPAEKPCDEKAARAQLEALKNGFDQFREAQLLGGRELKPSLNRMVGEHRELEQQYRKIAARQCGAPSVDALVIVGRLYEEFALKWIHAPIPEQLDAAQAEIFRSELAQRAVPLQAKARETWTEAVRKAKELGIADEFVDLAQRRLAATAAPDAR